MPRTAPRSGDRVLHHVGDFARQTFDEFAITSFDHHPQQRLGAGRAQQHAAAVAQGRFRPGLRCSDAAIGTPVEAGGQPHVDEFLRVEDEIGTGVGEARRHAA